MNRNDEASAAREALGLASPAEGAALAARAVADPELARELDLRRRAALALGVPPPLAPPPGFAARLSARALAEGESGVLGLPGRPALAATAATLLVAAGVALGAGLAGLAGLEVRDADDGWSTEPTAEDASLPADASLADLYLEASEAPAEEAP